MITKQCSKCGEEKSLDSFKKDKRAKDGKHSWCRSCNSDYRKQPTIYKRSLTKKTEARLRNLEHYRMVERKNWLKKKYNLTIEQYDEMLNKQNSSCAICKKHSDGHYRKLNIDHCHKTGTIRELLCNHCNTVLGKVEDSEDRLQEMINYLRKHRSKG